MQSLEYYIWLILEFYKNLKCTSRTILPVFPAPSRAQSGPVGGGEEGQEGATPPTAAARRRGLAPNRFRGWAGCSPPPALQGSLPPAPVDAPGGAAHPIAAATDPKGDAEPPLQSAPPPQPSLRQPVSGPENLLDGKVLGSKLGADLLGAGGAPRGEFSAPLARLPRASGAWLL